MFSIILTIIGIYFIIGISMFFHNLYTVIRDWIFHPNEKTNHNLIYIAEDIKNKNLIKSPSFWLDSILLVPFWILTFIKI
jgi:hypothetical protein